jgi:hypothetical protein
MNILVSDFTTFTFYQAYECFDGCYAYLVTTVVIVTDVITDFQVTVITLITEFTCPVVSFVTVYMSCRCLCYCLHVLSLPMILFTCPVVSFATVYMSCRYLRYCLHDLPLPLLLFTQKLPVFIGCCEYINSPEVFRSADIFCLCA